MSAFFLVLAMSIAGLLAAGAAAGA
jgi:hypothetical protein